MVMGNSGPIMNVLLSFLTLKSFQLPLDTSVAHILSPQGCHFSLVNPAQGSATEAWKKSKTETQENSLKLFFFSQDTINCKQFNL